jgi:hypothetical protein
MTVSPLVSVVVPTLRPDPGFSQMLRLFTDAGDEVETVVVDSGSDERDLDAFRACGARVIAIRPDEFSHSRARNLGASQARGRWLLFTVQDAMPPDAAWIHRLVAAAERYGVAALSCCEQPRCDADVFYRAMSWMHTRYMSPDGQDVVTVPADGDPRRNAPLSDVACLIDRQIFQGFEHRGDYGEDLDLGLRLVAAGHRLAFLTSEVVIHSHYRPAFYHLRRGFVDQLALDRLLGTARSAPPGVAAMRTDVQRTYDLVHWLARHPAIDRASTVDDMATSVLLGCRTRDPVTAPVDRSSHARIDDDTLHWLEIGGRGTTTPCDVMRHAVAGMMTGIFDYQHRQGPMLDALEREDLRRALYKAWAFQSGVHLAQSVASASDDADAASLRQALSARI